MADLYPTKRQYQPEGRSILYHIFYILILNNVIKYNNVHIDYYTAIFISHNILVRGRCISARDPLGIQTYSDRGLT